MLLDVIIDNKLDFTEQCSYLKKCVKYSVSKLLFEFRTAQVTQTNLKIFKISKSFRKI